MLLGVEELALCFAAIANFGIGLYVFTTNPRDPARKAFFLFVGGASLWVGGFTSLEVTLDFVFDTITQFGGLIGTLGFFLFAQFFPHKRFLPIRPWILYAPFFIALIGIVPWHFVVSDIRLLPSGGFIAIPGKLSVVWALFMGAYILASVALFVIHYTRAFIAERRKLRYLFLGICVSMLCALIFDLVLPGAFGISQFSALGPLSSIIAVGLTAYAIVRHELMDIRVIIQRGTIYVILLVGIVLTYLATLLLVGMIVGEGEGEEVISSVVTTVLGIFTVPALDTYFRRITDRIFFKDTYDYALTLQTLSESLQITTNFDELVSRIRKELSDVFRASFVDISFSESEHVSDAVRRQVEDRKILHQPIRVDDERVGTIVVAEKRSGGRYRSEDVRFLRTFSLQAATALARAKLFREVQEYATTLEKKVTERTKELERSQESERQMMLDIAHGLQTPLAVFQIKLEKLRSAHPDIDVRTFEESIWHLSDFIENLLKLATFEHRAQPAQLELCCVSTLLKDITEEIHIIATPRNIKVTSTIENDIHIQANSKDFRSAIINLASNALKYMKGHGERKIDFSLRAGDTVAYLTVHDSGMGIAAEDLPHIFDRFYRANRQRPSSGNGLGLAITRSVISEIGGVISAQSVPGESTTMTIQVPLARENLAA